MKKRKCKRFTIPGTTLFFKKRKFFFFKTEYSNNYYPVLDLSKGGASFLCNQRIKPCSSIIVKIIIPGMENPLEIIATTRWIARNREESYRFQTGVSFNTYGKGRNQNSPQILKKLMHLEASFYKNYN